MFLARWRARRANRNKIDQIHGEIVAAARDPRLYADFGVPDDLDGRFEAMSLCAGLVVRRLQALGGVGPDMAQDVVDRVFGGFEDALREMSIADAGVAKRMKSMISAFGGRNQAYDAALSARDANGLAAALSRNLFRAGAGPQAPGAAKLAECVLAWSEALDALPIESFAEGPFRFPKGDPR